jgi:hypothetical protein
MAKDPAAVSLGRRGGKARLEKMTSEDRIRVAMTGVRARLKKMTPKERQAVARKAAEARWSKLEKKVDEISKGAKALVKLQRKKAKGRS